MPRIESDSKRTGLVPPTVGRKPRSARTIQRAPTVPIPPQRVAVEARPCAWAGRARSCGGRPGAARLAPSAERRRRAAGRFGLGPPAGRAPAGMVGRAPGRQGRARSGGRPNRPNRSTVPRFWAATFNDRDCGGRGVVGLGLLLGSTRGYVRRGLFFQCTWLLQTHTRGRTADRGSFFDDCSCCVYASCVRAMVGWLAPAPLLRPAPSPRH